MPNLKTARQKGKIDDFIKEHEADPEGDLDKLDEVIKSPTRETGSAIPKASSRVSDDGWNGIPCLSSPYSSIENKRGTL